MIHPHDFALLNDALDERLAPAAADDLRRRLADEPALAAAYEELRRMRASLAALPAPRVPADFLARVRERAGLPPAAATPAAALRNGAVAPPTRAATPIATRADAPAADATDPRAGRVVPMDSFLRRFALPIAAVLGIAIGGGVFLASHEGAPEDAVHGTANAARDGASRYRGASDEVRVAGPAAPGAPPTGDPHAPPETSVATTNAAAPGEAASAGRPAGGAAPPPTPDARGRRVGGPFRQPGGAVPENLRSPADPPAPPGAPAPVTAATSGAGGEALAPAGSGAREATPPVAEDDRDAPDRDAPALAGRAPGSKGVAKRESGPPLARDTARSDGLAWAGDDVDAVVVIHAASVDEARAELAVLLATPAATPPPAEPQGASDAAVAKKLRDAPADDATSARVAAALATARLSRQEGARVASSASLLGSFVAEVTPAAWEALGAARQRGRPEADAPAASSRPGEEERSDKAKADGGTARGDAKDQDDAGGGAAARARAPTSDDASQGLPKGAGAPRGGTAKPTGPPLVPSAPMPAPSAPAAPSAAAPPPPPTTPALPPPSAPREPASAAGAVPAPGALPGAPPTLPAADDARAPRVRRVRVLVLPP